MKSNQTSFVALAALGFSTLLASSAMAVTPIGGNSQNWSSTPIVATYGDKDQPSAVSRCKTSILPLLKAQVLTDTNTCHNRGAGMKLVCQGPSPVNGPNMQNACVGSTKTSTTSVTVGIDYKMTITAVASGGEARGAYSYAAKCTNVASEIGGHSDADLLNACYSLVTSMTQAK